MVEHSSGGCPALRFGVAYDFRNPPDSGKTTPDLYRSVLEQVQWLDACGLDLVWFTEHHFVDDGYLPSWIPAASAAAAMTKRVVFSSDICLLPFNNPVRLAEDLAILDNVSNGRVEIGVGMGYAVHEFDGFGIPIAERVSRTEEGIEVLKRCFTGERFSYHGKRYQFNGVQITPGYVQPQGPPLWVAAMSKPGALRAARHDTHLLPQGSRPEVLDPWRDSLIESDRDPNQYRVGLLKSVFVSDDEAAWERIRQAERYRMQSYGSFSSTSRFAPSNVGATYSDPELISQRWIVGESDQCVEELTAFVLQYGFTDIVTWGTPPGIPPEAMNESLERFVMDVAPRVRARVDAAYSARA
ncbi:MAG: LLM class flavin-dependent oxidoreductase [Pseudomonadota bacterium]